MTWRAGDLAYVLPSNRLVRLEEDPRGGLVLVVEISDPYMHRWMSRWKERGQSRVSVTNLMGLTEDEVSRILLEVLE